MKRFLYKSIIYIAIAALPVYVPFIVYIFCIKPYLSGDIDSLAMIPFPKGYVTQDKTLNKSYFNCELKAIPSDSCMLIIGDSFSQNDNDSKTTYINYLAESMNIPVYNLSLNWRENLVDICLYLANCGNLPQIIILESVERTFNRRLMTATFDMTATHLDSVVKFHESLPETLRKQQISDFKRSQDYVRHRFLGRETGVLTLRLSQPLFSVDEDNSSILYFFDEDISFLTDTTNYYCIEKKMQQLTKIFEAQNCLLYFLVAADKYDVYYPYIENNPYPKNNTLDSLSSHICGVNFINSKDTLKDLVNKGIKDVYWCNDSHWSVIGCKAVGEYVAKRILMDRRQRFK